ncbi:MAG: hypothetical protein AAB552_00655 [Patescibacteria group bacterium]
MLSQEALQKILGIKEDVYVTPEEMADKLNITFFPYDPRSASAQVLKFLQQLEKTFLELNVNIVPYEKALVKIPTRKILKKVYLLSLNNLFYVLEKITGRGSGRNYVELSAIKKMLLRPKRVKAGISIIAIANEKAGELPIDYTSSFRHSSVVTVLDMPSNISKESTFHEHFDTAMSLFAQHMTNIVIGVNQKEWILYNFNASHPVYPLHENFKANILKALISKIVAPIMPYRFSDFAATSEHFKVTDEPYKSLVADFLASGELLEKASLYPKGKKINDLPFRNEFYKLVGKIHLDNRSGMSYGFLALQMPVNVTPAVLFEKSPEKEFFMNTKKDYIVKEDGTIFIAVELSQAKYVVKVPDIFVLSQKSGSDKTNFNPDKDLIRLGLVKGAMVLATPEGLVLTSDFKPSFDTKVILAHAVGNAIVASLLKVVEKESKFVDMLEARGMALVHWHGYVNQKFIPDNFHVHGAGNPHVSCSSPQSALYAIDGKLRAFSHALTEGVGYLGDVHIEPHHGTNMTFPSLEAFGRFVTSGPEVTSLGNKYLH